MQGNTITVTQEDMKRFLEKGKREERGQLLLNILKATRINPAQKEAYLLYACSLYVRNPKFQLDDIRLKTVLIHAENLSLNRKPKKPDNLKKDVVLLTAIFGAAKDINKIKQIDRALLKGFSTCYKKAFLWTYLKAFYSGQEEQEFPFALMAFNLTYSDVTDDCDTLEDIYFKNWFKLFEKQETRRHSRMLQALSNCDSEYYLSWQKYYIDALINFLVDCGKIDIEEKLRVRQEMNDSTLEYANALLRIIKIISDNNNLSEKFTNQITWQFFMKVMRVFILSVKLTQAFSRYFIDLDKKINGQSLRDYLHSKAMDTNNKTKFLTRLKFLTNFLTAVLEAQQRFLEPNQVPESASSNEEKWGDEEKPASKKISKINRMFPELSNSNLDSSVIELNKQLWQCANAYKDELSWSMLRSDRLRQDYLPEILRVFVEHQQLSTDHNAQITYSNKLEALIEPFKKNGVPKEVQSIFVNQLMKLFNTINHLSPRFSEYLNFDRSVLAHDSFGIYLSNKINELAQKDPITFFRQFRALLLMLKCIVETDQILALQHLNEDIPTISFGTFRHVFDPLVDVYKGGSRSGTNSKMRTVYQANFGGESPESKLTMGTASLTLDEILSTIEKFSSTQDNVMGALQNAAFVLGFLEQNAISSAFSDHFIALDTLVDGKTLKQYLEEAVGSYWNGYQHLDDVIAMITLVATYANYSAQEREHSKAAFNEAMEAICGNMDDCGEGLDYFYHRNEAPAVLFEILEIDAKSSIQDENELLSILSRIERRLATENPVRLAKLAQFVCAILDNPTVNSICTQWLGTSLDKAHPDFETVTFREYLKIKVNDTLSVIKEPYRHLEDVVDFLKLLCNSTQCTPENIKNICDMMSKSGTMEKIYLQDYFAKMAPAETKNCKPSSDGIELRPVASSIRLAGLMPSQFDVELELELKQQELIPMFTSDSDEDEDENGNTPVIKL